MVGIGFFSPLPLAYMIPFMAAQSLAMGEAFGKGFQYGKRKISAQTNEEFNKFTFQNMWDEQNTNIKMLLPSLNEQLDSSIQLQQNIFKHMFELIPIFINEMAKATNTIIGNLTFQNTGDSQNPAQALADYINNIFNIPEAGADAPPDNPFIGPPEPLPDTLKQHIQIQKDLQPNKGTTRTQTSNEQSFVTWQHNIIAIQEEFDTAQREYNIAQNNARRYKNNRSLQASWAQKMKKPSADMLTATKKLRVFSNDYRNPNPEIQRAVIFLRQQMASGRWSRVL